MCDNLTIWYHQAFGLLPIFHHCNLRYCEFTLCTHYFPEVKLPCHEDQDDVKNCPAERETVPSPTCPIALGPRWRLPLC